MCDHVFRVDMAGFDVLEASRDVPLHAGLIRAQRESLVHDVADRDHVCSRSVNTDDRHNATFTHRIYRPIKRGGRARLQFQSHACDVLHHAAFSLGADTVDGAVPAKPVRLLFKMPDGIIDVAKVERLALRELSRKFEAVIVFVHDHDATGAHEPGATCRKQANRPRPEHQYGVAPFDSRHFGALIAGRKRVGAKRRIVVVYFVRDRNGRGVRKRNAHVFSLTAVVASRRMRVAIDAARGRRIGIGVVAIAVEAFLAEVTLAAEDVERYEDAISLLQRLDFRPDRFDHSDKFVAERLSHTSVRNEAVIKVQVRPADACTGHAHDGIAWMFNVRIGLIHHADPVRAAIGHR